MNTQTFTDKQYSRKEAEAVAKTEKAHIFARISPDDFDAVETAYFSYEVDEDGFGRAHLAELETEANAQINDVEDDFNDYDVEEIISFTRENLDKDLSEVLEMLQVDFDSFVWENTSFYYFDEEEFKQKAYEKFGIYYLPGGFQSAIQTAKDFGHVDIFKIKLSYLPQKTGSSGQHHFTNYAWDKDLESLTVETQKWVKGHTELNPGDYEIRLEEEFETMDDYERNQ